MRIEKVIAPAEQDTIPEPEDKRKSPTKPELVAPRKEKQDKSGKQGKVISISDHRKKDKE